MSWFLSLLDKIAVAITAFFAGKKYVEVEQAKEILQVKKHGQEIDDAVNRLDDDAVDDELRKWTRRN